MLPRIAFVARSPLELSTLVALVVFALIAARAWRASRAPLALFAAYFCALIASLLMAHAIFQLPRYELSTYALMLVLGAFLAWTLLLRRLPEAGLSQGGTYAIIVGCLVLGVIGGRLVELVAQRITGSETSESGLRIAGLGVFGAFALDAIYVVLVLRFAFPGVSALRVLDAGAGPTLVNVGVARIGCLLAGCCHGAASHAPFAFPVAWFDPSCPAGASLSSHIWPTQPVESAAALALAVVCSELWRRRETLALAPGAIIGLAAMGYGTIRFALEFFRGDSVRLRFGLTVWQCCAVFLVLLGATKALRRRPA